MKINLIPEVKQEQQKIKKLNATVVSSAIAVLVVTVGIIILLVGYNIYRTTQISMIKKDIDKTNKVLESYKDLEETVATLENGLIEIKQLLAGEAKWSRFLAELEKATPADIQFKTFDIKNTAITATLAGSNVSSIDRFIKSFDNYKVDDKNLFNNLVVNGYATEGGKVNFQATLNLVGGILW